MKIPNFLEVDFDKYIWIINLIDKALQKYKLDSRVCSQKAVCWYVRESKYSVNKNKANKFEKFVDGLTRYFLI